MGKTSGSFKKGDQRKRKPKGAVNRTTKEAQEFFMLIMNRQVDRIEEALTKINKDDPEKYINSLSRLLQYYLPKKSDISIPDANINITFSKK